MYVTVVEYGSGWWNTICRKIVKNWSDHNNREKRFSADGQNIAQNCTTMKDNAVLDCSQPPEEDLQPILREEVEIAVAALKKGKSAGVDNIPAELVQAGGGRGGETMIDVLTEICNRIWRTGEWPTPWALSLIITLPKKGDLQLCQNY